MNAPPLVRPRGLEPGDLVGVLAPSGPVDADALARGVAELESLGLSVRVTPGTGARSGFTAGSAGQRLEELKALLRDPDVAAVFCARGGAGALHLLPGLEPELLRRQPKPFVGSSDATCLHAVYARAGVVSFHGPMVAMGLAQGRYDRENLRRVLFRGVAGGAPQVFPIDCLVPGSGSGRLRGGCLSLLAALVGTRWGSITPEPSLLFIEDVDERPYRLDRMLFQLRAAGAFDGVQGIVFGEMPGCHPGPQEGYTLEQVLCDALRGLDVPVAFGLASGHTSSSAGLTLPLGVAARLECDGGDARLVLDEEGIA